MMRNALCAAALTALLAGCVGTGIDTSFTDTSDTSTTDTSDTGYYTGPWQFASVSYTCTAGTPDQWTYDATLDGLADHVEVMIAETGDCHWAQYEAGTPLSGCSANDNDPSAIWTEDDLMDLNYDYDSVHGTYDKWRMTVSDVAAQGDVVAADPAHPNQGTTLWDCGYDSATDAGTTTNHDWQNGSLAWAFIDYDHQGNANDCVIFGRQSDQYFNGYKHVGDAVSSGHQCLCFEGDGSASYCQD